jgi:hypothetical protein
MASTIKIIDEAQKLKPVDRFAILKLSELN